MTQKSTPASGTFRLGNETTIHRMGYGAMRLTGKGVWGPPPDAQESVKVLRRAVALGVDFFDTADSYGPYVSEELIHRALYPYDGVTIATKAGFVRTGPGAWREDCDPVRLRRAAEGSLRRLGVESIDLYQLHRIDTKYPMEDQIAVFKKLQDEGKVRHIGLSEVGVEQIREVRKIVEVVSVQNQYNLADRRWEDVLNYCENEGIAFIPWYPIAVGAFAQDDGPLASIAAEIGATPVQVALAWLLRRSDVVIPIPGTNSITHLEENVKASAVTLTEEQFERLGESRPQK